MSEMVLKLALQAMADKDALPVLADALHESGWYFQDHHEGTWERWWSSLLHWEPHVAARAIAAVLLFEGWPTSWPLADAMQDGDILIGSGSLRYTQVKDLYSRRIIGRADARRMLSTESPKEGDSG